MLKFSTATISKHSRRSEPGPVPAEQEQSARDKAQVQQSLQMTGIRRRATDNGQIKKKKKIIATFSLNRESVY